MRGQITRRPISGLGVAIITAALDEKTWDAASVEAPPRNGHIQLHFVSAFYDGFEHTIDDPANLPLEIPTGVPLNAACYFYNDTDYEQWFAVTIELIDSDGIIRAEFSLDYLIGAYDYVDCMTGTVTVDKEGIWTLHAVLE